MLIFSCWSVLNGLTFLTSCQTSFITSFFMQQHNLNFRCFKQQIKLNRWNLLVSSMFTVQGIKTTDKRTRTYTLSKIGFWQIFIIAIAKAAGLSSPSIIVVCLDINSSIIGFCSFVPRITQNFLIELHSNFQSVFVRRMLKTFLFYFRENPPGCDVFHVKSSNFPWNLIDFSIENHSYDCPVVIFVDAFRNESGVTRFPLCTVEDTCRQSLIQ